MAMTEIVILKADELRYAAEALNAAANQALGAVRVCIDDGTMKVKVGEGVWSPPLGMLDPACEMARARVQATEVVERETCCDGPSQGGGDHCLRCGYSAEAHLQVKGMPRS